VLPEKSGVNMALMVPWMWWSGSTWSRWSDAEYSQACKSERACAVMTDCGSKTPFCNGQVGLADHLTEDGISLGFLTGRFVVPDV
jgi:hypothetical protein